MDRITEKSKFKIGDKAYYLDNGKINLIVIKRNDPVFNGKGEHIGWHCSIGGHKGMAYMDGVYAPISLSIPETELIRDLAELTKLFESTKNGH